MKEQNEIPQLVVNADRLPDSVATYVLWLDIMGIQSIMSRSLPISANFIFKFHSAAKQSQEQGLDIFPVMDGLYAVTTSQDVLKSFIRNFFERISSTFVSEKEDRHRFVVRGGLAYGPIIRGSDVSAEAAPTVAEDPNYSRTILLGMPVIQAHMGDKEAPPFGVFISESARAFAPDPYKPFNETWWRWFEPQQHKLAVNLRHMLDSYFKWCSAHYLQIIYEKARIADHWERSVQHLPEK